MHDSIKGLRDTGQGSRIGAVVDDGEGEMVPDESHDSTRAPMTVAEAARALGISESAVRRRVKRGKVEHERTPNGRLIVYLDSAATSVTGRDRVSEKSHNAPTERYVRGPEDRVEHLRNELDREREANRENKLIIAALEEQITELEASQTATVEPERRESHLPTVGPDDLGDPDEGDEHPRLRKVPENMKKDAVLAQFFITAAACIAAAAVLVISVLNGQLVLAGLGGGLALLSIVSFLSHWWLFRFGTDRVHKSPSEPRSSDRDI